MVFKVEVSIYSNKIIHSSNNCPDKKYNNKSFLREIEVLQINRTSFINNNNRIHSKNLELIVKTSTRLVNPQISRKAKTQTKEQVRIVIMEV
jgi:hypothetical protein